MISHSNFASVCAIFYHNPSLKKFLADTQNDGVPLIHLSYLPLPHVFERLVLTSVLHLGGEVYMYSGDILKIKNDLLDVRPTIFVSVPRLYNKFYDKIKDGFSKKSPFLQALIKVALESKFKNIQHGCHYNHALWDKLIFDKIKNDIFGGRVRCMISGSAPISKDVLNFL